MRFKKTFFVVGCIALVVLAFYSLRSREKVPATVLLNEKIKNIDFDVRWDVHESPAALTAMQALLSHPCTFLGKGKQCIAYATYDGNHVVKILLQRPLRLKERVSKLPDFFPFSTYKNYLAKSRIRRKKALFTSFLISSQMIPEHTGIKFVHLNPTEGLFKKMLFIDKAGDPCFVDLDGCQFVVQKRAKLVKPTIATFMWEQNVDGAKRCIDQIFDLLLECAKKGVFDIDTGLIRNDNIGLLEDRAIYIDTGKLRYMPQEDKKSMFLKDVRRLRPLHRWLSLYYPELAAYYEEREREAIASF